MIVSKQIVNQEQYFQEESNIWIVGLQLYINRNSELWNTKEKTIYVEPEQPTGLLLEVDDGKTPFSSNNLLLNIKTWNKTAVKTI